MLMCVFDELTLAVSGAGPQTPNMQTERRAGVHSTALVRHRRHLLTSRLRVWLIYTGPNRSACRLPLEDNQPQRNICIVDR